MGRIGGIGAVILAGLAMAPTSAIAEDHVIAQSGRAFHPAEITIAKDDTLTFTNQDDFIHQVYVVDLFDSEEKAPGEKLTENFPRAGTFEVRCHIHPKMRLVVHVK
jgi:plastocyanin